MEDLSGLLVEGFGFRPRDRAPMAASKARAGPTRSASTSAPAKPPPPRPPNPSHSSLDHGFGDLDTFFARPVPDDDLFGGFPGGGGSAGANDDIFGSFPAAGNADSIADLLGDFGGGIVGKGKGSGGRSSGANSSADLLGDFGGGIGDEGRRDSRSGVSAGDSAPVGADSSADLLGDFGGGSGGEGKGSGGGSGGKGAGGLDELIPGFGRSSPPRVLEDSHKKSSGYDKLAASIPKDPFIDLESTVSASHSSGSFTNTFDEFDILSGTVKSDKKSTAVSADNNIFDAFERSSPLFASDVKIDSKPPRVEERRNNRPPAGLNGFHRSSDVDLMFAETKMESDPLVDLVTKPSNPMEPATMKSDQHERNSVKHVDSADDIWFSVSATLVKQPSVPSSNIRKAASSPNILDDWNSLFGAPSSEEFQEIEGETEERRRARYERHQRTLERAAKALNEKNERDIQIERENAERHRIAERLDADIKRWAAGKEGNLRALLSSLQYVLWSESGWQPVTITDLITSASVKKVYRKATLCIHPDKVQQKGANLEQKYTAEKVFDLLKGAWKKFNMEELS